MHKLVIVLLLLLFLSLSISVHSETPLYHINCGGQSYVDKNNILWSSDLPFLTSPPSPLLHKTIYSPRLVTNTDSTYLYLSERWCSDCTQDKPLTYSFHVEKSGEYSVMYHFVLFKPSDGNRKKFTIMTNQVNTQVDLNGEPTNRAIVRSVDVIVSDSNQRLIVQLMKSQLVDTKVSLCAIEIIFNGNVINEPPVPSPSPVPSPIPSPPPVPVNPCDSCLGSCCSQQCFNPETHRCVDGIIAERPKIQEDIFPGVIAYYYDYLEMGDNLVNFPPVHLKKPSLAFIEHGEFDKPQGYTLFRNSPWTNYFAVRFHFYLNVPESGLYTFLSRSNDGTILYIDGVKVVDNDFNHDVEVVERASGQIGLNAGVHLVQYDFYQSMHRSGLSLKWILPSSTQEQLVPSSAFTYRRSQLKPLIHSLSSTNAPVGTSIIVKGFGFVFPSQETTVRFGNLVASSVSVLDDERVQVVIPEGGSGVVSVTIETPNDSSNGIPFTYYTTTTM